MRRRHLLVGLALGAVMPAQALVGFSTAPSTRFRWTRDGRVDRRTATGWVTSLDLGPEIEILALEETGPDARLLARHGTRRFELHSMDGRHWRTESAKPRRSSSSTRVGMS
jgi:hypothetical protein